MGLFRVGAAREQVAGGIAITLLAIEDPYETPITNGHTTEADRLGLARLVAFEVALHNASTELAQVSGGKFHLFDDLHFVHESLGLDSRSRAPRLQEVYVSPGTTVRGWVTYRLDWERRPARLQFFTGHLSGKVAVFELPMDDPAARAQRRAEARERAARGEVEARLAVQEREVATLEARAEQARAVLAHASRVQGAFDALRDPDGEPDER